MRERTLEGGADQRGESFQGTCQVCALTACDRDHARAERRVANMKVNRAGRNVDLDVVLDAHQRVETVGRGLCGAQPVRMPRLAPGKGRSVSTAGSSPIE